MIMGPIMKSLATQYWKNQRGSFSVIFAISLLVIIIVGGVAVDLNRLQSSRTKVQDYLDAAVLASAIYLHDADSIKNLNKKQQLIEAEKIAKDVFAASFHSDSLELSFDKLELSAGKLVGHASGQLSTTVVSFFNVETLALNVTSATNMSTSKAINVDVVLIADITGSMALTLTAVQDNIKSFSDDLKFQLETHNVSAKNIRIKLIFFRDYIVDSTPLWAGADMNLVAGMENNGPMYISKFFKFPNESLNLDKYVDSFNAWGGGGIAESGLESVWHALNADWNASKNTTRAVVLWTDAPARILHDNSESGANFPQRYDDYYPKDVPANLDGVHTEFAKFHKKNSNNIANVTTMSVNIITSINLNQGATYPQWVEIGMWDGVDVNYDIPASSAAAYQKILDQVTETVLSQVEAKDLAITH